MIIKWYEITCDYCCPAIAHEIGSAKFAEQLLIEQGGFVKGKHHFCNENCYNKWLENGKKSVLGD